MVKIRLAKVGKTHQVSYRIVATESRSKRDGKFLEVLGFYNQHNTPQLQLDRERLAHWTQKGAKPTLAVENLIKLGHLVKQTSKRKAKQAQPKVEEPKAQLPKTAPESRE